jgi:NADH dehydrogenase FAD-containing subunit
MAIKKLVFVGAGQSNLYALAAFKQSPRIDTDIHLITPFDHVAYSEMVPGMVSGHYSADDCAISLPKLLDRTAIKITYAACIGIDTAMQTVHLNDGSTRHYDVLSLDTGSVMDRDVIDAFIPGAKEHAVFVHPLEQFIKLWPKIEAHAEQMQAHHWGRIAVIGAGAMGIELAMALKHRLPTCTVTLVTGPAAPATGFTTSVQNRVMRALKQRNITVLQDSCVRMGAQQIYLASGASLACDMPLLTIGEHAPVWLKDSSVTDNLALDERGYLAVNAFQQSTSHPNIFAAGDAANNTGSTLYANLRASLMDQPKTYPFKAHRVERRALNLIACGERSAIASLGKITLQGKWVWQWKNAINHRWLRLYKQ